MVPCGKMNRGDESLIAVCGGTKNNSSKSLCFLVSFGLYFLLQRERTCAHDGCKHPALAVLDRTVARDGPHPQDVPAAGPRARIDPLFEIAGPVPLQHALVVFAVDLDEEEETNVGQGVLDVTCSSSARGI